jgi:hypothetical protein
MYKTEMVFAKYINLSAAVTAEDELRWPAICMQEIIMSTLKRCAKGIYCLVYQWLVDGVWIGESIDLLNIHKS